MGMNDWPEWEKALQEKLFSDFTENRKSGLCAWCGIPINIGDFTDSISLHEYDITGTCQKCQNEFFGENE